MTLILKFEEDCVGDTNQTDRICLMLVNYVVKSKLLIIYQNKKSLKTEFYTVAINRTWFSETGKQA